MIATTLGAIAAAEPALDRLGARPLPMKTAYTTSKLLRLVRDELKTFRTLHDDLVKRHGAEDPPGSGSYRVPPGAQYVTFRAELDTLMATPVEIAWTPIALDALGDEPVRADDLLALDPFLSNGTPAVPSGA
jgi:hypothetical protein